MRTLNQARDLTFVTMNCSTQPWSPRSRALPRHRERPACPLKFEEIP